MSNVEAEIGGLNTDRLKSIIERIESVDSEINDLKEDRKGIMLEAKSAGFDTKAITYVLKQRKKSKAQRDEEELVFETYERAVGL
ncbi:MAG: DUF2312 domain-containing protein [Bacilli bacterium]|nr:DUF2312 domain-containing protein [Clostridia bacterium]MBR4618407.1 DUF2312 domain-containing protein [Bacilli bacterium]